MLCPTCQDEMRQVPAGISKKTGKPYRAFFACDKQPCKDAKAQSRTQAQYPAQNAPQANFEANYASLSEKVATLEMALANMRVWASKMEKRVSGLETLEEGKALDLHQSFPVRDIHEAKDIVENGIINQTPEGFDK